MEIRFLILSLERYFARYNHCNPSSQQIIMSEQKVQSVDLPIALELPLQYTINETNLLAFENVCGVDVPPFNLAEEFLQEELGGMVFRQYILSKLSWSWYSYDYIYLFLRGMHSTDGIYNCY